MINTRSSFFISGAVIALVIVAPLVALAAWSEPTQAPTGGNVDPPINTGSGNQVKNGGLSVNTLAVFGSTAINGNTYLKTGVTGSIYRYLNFGVDYDVNGDVIATTIGDDGYGIRDKHGTLEFKNLGGDWSSIQSTVQNLTGITSAVSTTTFSTGINIPSGCFAVNGTCLGTGGGSISGWEFKTATTYSTGWYYVYCTSGKKVMSCTQTSGSGYPGAAWPQGNSGCGCYNLNDVIASCGAICVN